MLVKFLIIILIFIEQIGLPVNLAQKINKTINKVEGDKKSSTIFLLSDRKDNSEVIKFNKNENPVNLNVSPLPIKKQDTSDIDPACVSACSLDFDTSQILLVKNKDQKLPMASLAKIMTTFIILKDNNLDEQVTIKETAIQIASEESQMGLTPGDKIKVKDLLYGILIYSANDGSKALAEYKAGSEEKFIKLMNAEASELGLKNTNFTSVSGIDAPNQYSSAYDLTLLFKCAVQNSLFLQMINTKDYEFVSENGTHYVLTNTDELLGTDPRVLGGKTGSTDQAGRCFASLASQDDHKVITVLMNCPDRFGETKNILDWVYSSYIW
jgi:D-alanyl-D-alanine carboxypeptidase